MSDLSKEARRFVEEWAACLPPKIARTHVEWFTGGITTRDSLAHEDSKGTGPDGAHRVGMKVIYDTRSLLVWLVRTRGLERVQSVAEIKGYRPNFTSRQARN